MAGILPSRSDCTSPPTTDNTTKNCTPQECVNNENSQNNNYNDKNNMQFSLQQDTSIKKSSSKRKKWSVQDGPKNLLRRMRSQLAEDGCPESQFVLAKTLLEQKEEDSSEESDRLAVFWLIQASLQGNIEATEQLQHCLDNNIGICDHNYQEVVNCLNMDQQEKLARQAGRALFSSLSDGNEFVTSARLYGRVQDILEKHEKGELDSEDDIHDDILSDDGELDHASRMRELYGGERFTEEHIVSAAVLYSQGYLPPLRQFIVPYSRPQTKFFKWPLTIWYQLYEQLLNFLGVEAVSTFYQNLSQFSPLIFSVLICSIIFCVSQSNTNYFNNIIPSILWCIALTSMVLASANMIANFRRLEVFRMWSEVFASYCPNLDVHLAEFRFRRLSWKPYLSMWVALCIYLGCLPYIDNSLVIYTYPAMLLCTLVTFFSLSDRISLWKVISIVVYSVAIIPAAHEAIRELLLQFSSGSTFDFLLEDGQFTLFGFMQLNYGLAPFFYMLWILVLIIGSLTRGISGILMHLVNIIWCHITVLAARNVAHPAQLMYPAIAWSTLGLMPIASSTISLIGPGVLVSVCCLRIGATLWISAGALLLAISSVFTFRKLWPEMLNIVRVTLIALCLLYLAQPILQSNNNLNAPSSLKWTSYQNVCMPTSDKTLASTVNGCQVFKGIPIRWEGKVAQVNIKSITNWPEKLMKFVPSTLHNKIQCTLGVPLHSCLKTDSDKEYQRCLIIRNLLGSNHCTLENWNIYEFELLVSMGTSFWKFGKETPLVSLRAGNQFKDFFLGLEIGDDIEYTGTLVEDLGTLSPKVDLHFIECEDCSKKLSSLEIQYTSSIIDLHQPMRHIFNFFFSPLLTI